MTQLGKALERSYLREAVGADEASLSTLAFRPEGPRAVPSAKERSTVRTWSGEKRSMEGEADVEEKDQVSKGV